MSGWRGDAGPLPSGADRIGGALVAGAGAEVRDGPVLPAPGASGPNGLRGSPNHADLEPRTTCERRHAGGASGGAPCRAWWVSFDSVPNGGNGVGWPAGEATVGEVDVVPPLSPERGGGASRAALLCGGCSAWIGRIPRGAGWGRRGSHPGWGDDELGPCIVATGDDRRSGFRRAGRRPARRGGADRARFGSFAVVRGDAGQPRPDDPLAQPFGQLGHR